MSATRGRHPKVVICDDILSDFNNALSSVELMKIERVFRQAIMSLPSNPDDPLIVIGTPQSYDDLLYSLANTEGWLWVAYPAIADDINKIVLWPEKFSYDRLKKIEKQLTKSVFQVEFLLLPARVGDQFFSRDDVLAVIDPKLKKWPLEYEFDKGGMATYGGFDVGKQVHPSHVVIFLELENGTLVQIYEEFLDHMRYNTQVHRLNEIARVFGLSRGYFDSTYNVLEDRGLSTAWRGRKFTRQLKGDMATLFEKRMAASPDEKGIILLNDVRQIKQITMVDKQLKAATTVDGHGDAFWSCGLAIKAADDGPGIINIGSPMTITNKLYGPSQMWTRQLGAR